MSNRTLFPFESFSGWPEHTLQRIGIWLCGGAQEALAARRLVEQLARAHPEASLLVLGPRDALAFFEMDERIAAYLPLGALQPPRPAQTALARYLENRAQFRKLKQLHLNACVGVLPTSSIKSSKDRPAERLWRLFVRMVGFNSALAIALECDEGVMVSCNGSVLQPGPQAIAHANKIYHLAPPRSVKVLVYLGKASDSVEVLKQREQAAHQLIQTHQSHLLGSMGHELFSSVLVVSSGDRLQHRRVTDNLASVSLVNWSQLIGHMAYADWVLPVSGEISAIAGEMGRQSVVFPL